MLRSTTHKASLVDSSLHSPAMLDLLELKVDRLLIEHIVQSTIDTVSFAMNSASTSFSSRGRATSSSNNHGLFTIFASDTIRRSQATIPILLVTLVYINRSGCHLLIQSEKWACERVFLGALILAAKYLNDASLKNVHWATCTGIFGKRDIGRVEREFLDVLDWNLSISEADILDHHDSIMSLYGRSRGPSRPRRPLHSSLRKSRTFHRVETEDARSAGSFSSSSSSSPRTPPTLESDSHQLLCVKSPPTLEQFEYSESAVPHASRGRISGVIDHIPVAWRMKEATHQPHAIPAVLSL